jgi:hypothetical protein
MTTPAIRAALERLVSAYAACQGQYEETWPSLLDEPMATATAALAEPVGEGPSDEKLIQLAIDTRLYRFQATAGDFVQYEMTEQQIHAFARAVLARWGQGQ